MIGRLLCRWGRHKIVVGVDVAQAGDLTTIATYCVRPKCGQMRVSHLKQKSEP